MTTDPFRIKPLKVNYSDPFGRQKKKTRKAFTTSTKKIEWMKAGGHKAEEYTEKKVFYKASKCRSCKRKLVWGDRSYDFDHRDNNSAKNSQSNCYLVCKVCHGKATVIGKRKKYDPYLHTVIGHETVKKKVGYKKAKRKPKKKRKAGKTKSPFEISIPSIKIPRF